jgi:2-phosphosulfolactate phosphatase
MKIQYATLDTCASATGVVVAIDVMRAYTTAAYALAAGAREIILTSTIEEALGHRQRLPEALVMGEVRGLPAPGFDLGNSPSALVGLDLNGRTLVHRTSAGTQGAVRAVSARALFGASFVVAAATVRAIRALQPEQVTLVATGFNPSDSADEDYACADYLSALLTAPNGEPQIDPAPYLERVRRAETSEKFLDPARPEFPAEDVDRCAQIDQFPFALRIERQDGLLFLRKQQI